MQERPWRICVLSLIYVSLRPVSSQEHRTEHPTEPGGAGQEVQGYAAARAVKESIERSSEIQAIFDLLERGEQELVLSDIYKDVVLVLGNTGSGKSTFSQWIAGDNSALMAVETSKDSDEFIIRDSNNRISDSTIDSKTIFPELIIDPLTDAAFYDVSGFSDTRSTSNDIATNCFIKKIVDHVNSIKICIIVSYPSVRKGVDRHDFMKLVRHTTELIKDIDKFKNSIALIVTKVDHQYIMRGNKPIPVNDSKIIENIANFIYETKQDLEGKLSNAVPKEQFFIEKALKFLDILLSKNGDTYNKIGIFKRPQETGALSEIFQFEEEKEYIRTIIFENIRFVINTHDLFGHTISEKSKNDINDLVEEINKNILKSVQIVSNKMQKYFTNIVALAENKINFFDINEIDTVDLNLSQAQAYLDIISKGSNSLNNLIKELETVTKPKELSQKIKSSLCAFDIKEADQVLLNILKQGQYLDFLGDVSDKEVKISATGLEWGHLFQSIVTELSEPLNRIHNNVTDIVDQVEFRITNDIIRNAKKLKTYFTTKEKNAVDIQRLYEQINTAYNFMSKTLQTEYSMAPEKYVQGISTYGVWFSNHTTSNVIKNIKYFDILKININSVIEYVNNSQKWYYFLIKLYERLSMYEIQINTTACRLLSNAINKFSENNVIEITSLGSFLDRCFPTGYTEYNKIRKIVLDELKLKTLRDVFDLTLNQKLDMTSCDANGKLVLKGQHIKLSDIKHKSCNNKINSIEIFALDTVFIDDDLDSTGNELQLFIIAPAWVVIGNHKITLDGTPGESHYPTKAANGGTRGANGEDGQPGLPGGPGGNFLGVGNTFINGKELTISANGGDGGPGQHGGDGISGLDGTIPYLSTSSFDYLLTENGENVVNDWKRNGFSVSVREIGICTNLVQSCRKFYVSGKSCTNGGNAGNAGRAGYGGNPGIITILPSYHAADVKIINLEGKSVSDAKCGGRGNAGSSGGRLVVIESKESYVAYFKKDYVIDSSEIIKCEAGKSTCVFNSKNIRSPKASKSQNKHNTLVDYANYVSSNFDKTLKESNLKSFYNIIMNLV